jgi:hypothetical protein
MLPEPTIGSVESWNLGFETPHPFHHDGALKQVAVEYVFPV